MDSRERLPPCDAPLGTRSVARAREIQTLDSVNAQGEGNHKIEFHNGNTFPLSAAFEVSI